MPKAMARVCVALCACFLMACDDLIINDEGQVSLGLEDCENVAFTILVKQQGKPNVSDTKQVKDGVLALDVADGKFDFSRPIQVEVMAVGPGAEACGIDGVRVFDGTATPVGVGDHKISLGDFTKR
jgi:hypothetical protein